MLELCEQLGVDFSLDLLAAQGARPFKAEHQRRAPALQGLAPDAHRGPHADVALIHLIVRGLGQPLRPARDHPFAFDFHKFIIPPIPLASLRETDSPDTGEVALAPEGERWPRRAGGREPCHSPKYFG